MAEGVTTRLQKEVGQLQKDVEKMESKLDGMAEQLQAEIRLEIMKGIETLRLEMVKNGQNASVTTEEAISGKQGSSVVDLPSPVNNQNSLAGSSGAAVVSNLETKAFGLGSESLNNSL